MDQNQWIPVTERLPEVNKVVEVTVYNGHTGSAYYDGTIWRHAYGGYEITRVIAWAYKRAPYSPPKAENNAGTE